MLETWYPKNEDNSNKTRHPDPPRAGVHGEVIARVLHDGGLVLRELRRALDRVHGDEPTVFTDLEEDGARYSRRVEHRPISAAGDADSCTDLVLPVGLLIAGRTGVVGELDGFYAKVSATTGAIVWQRTLGVAGDDVILDSLALPNGDAILTGYTTSTGSGQDGWITRIDGTGAVVWSKTLGGAGKDQLTSAPPVISRLPGTMIVAPVRGLRDAYPGCLWSPK